MNRQPVSERSILALARAVGIEIPAEDLPGLTRAFDIYAGKAAKLEPLDVEAPDAGYAVDPRAEW
jgi:hypothetical protein